MICPLLSLALLLGCRSLFLKCKSDILELLCVCLGFAEARGYISACSLLGTLFGFLLFLESFLVCLEIRYLIDILLYLDYEDLGLLDLVVVKNGRFGEFLQLQLTTYLFTGSLV